MEQEGSARERIMAAFINKLETAPVSADDAVMLTRNPFCQQITLTHL